MLLHRHLRRRRSRAAESVAARARLDHRHAGPRRRLGRVRRRQQLTPISTTSRSPTTARCSIRRPPTSPRAASPSSPSSGAAPTTRSSRARSPGCARSRRPTAPGSAAGARTTSTAPGRVLCALNAAAGAGRRSGGAARGGVSCWRRSATTAAGARTMSDLRRGAARPLPAQQPQPDRLGAAGVDGGRRGRSSGGGARHRLAGGGAEAGRRMGRGAGPPPSVSRACSTCATTAIGLFFPLWRWRATAT